MRAARAADSRSEIRHSCIDGAIRFGAGPAEFYPVLMSEGDIGCFAEARIHFLPIRPLFLLA